MSRKKLHNASSVLDRIRHAYGLKSDAELAKYFEKHPSTISTWRRRNTMDYELIFSKCRDVNANYIIHGDMPMMRTDTPAGSDDVIHDLKKGYTVQNIIDRIENLSIGPDEKLTLLRSYLNILEQKQKE